MERKDYTLEIVNTLLKSPNHVRGAAKELGVNHMMVSRKLKELLDENVVDYRQEGKNKVFFLKKTLEAKNHVYAAEHYKLLQAVKKYPHLRKIIQAVQENKGIKMAVLFGSYAKGLAKKDSDIDIYVETTDKKIKQDLELLDSRLSVKIGKYNRENLLIKEIEKNHVIIKGVEEYYEKTPENYKPLLTII
ncbi:MAG: nucleotidyltransferase domain-containing protein [Euryarchaeota archaeon]|nr:nucleotidyltransferase domain-containing protein [Euryarchaeota archaeon]